MLLSMREAILASIGAEMTRDPNVVVIGQDIGIFGGPLKSTEGLLDRFGPDRILEMPICESGMTAMAVGAALTGLRPIVEIMFTDLLPVATTSIVQVAAAFRYMTDGLGIVPMVIRARGGDGPYRAHPQNYEALFSHAPGLVVVFPSNPADAMGLMRSAIRADDPVLFIENIFLYNAPKGEVPEGAEFAIPLGSANVVRSGKDVTVATYGRAVRTSLAAAEQLAAEGIDAEIVDLRTVRPIDRATVLASIEKTGRMLSVHEAWLHGGIGGELVAEVLEEGWSLLKAPPVRIGAPPVSVPWAEPLRDLFVPTAGRIADECRKLVRS
jgi:pyruvate/2-oxoglutarate/acetoin dehydrogenase E1 component